ncbi:ribonuclease Z [Candidatus Woesearchaeota archaeon CG08_land_8_20_14_0_20_47_9]|nr:MAG: ribonuclease Z [Candidatus Woesearchaeota archaeon CG1_02_47_18]PIO03272.1 MAG: ribonuclease Z [Candidatus Woesearchaeota archaeon CG08_land_8_20_14_0_20_47_9]HII29636.1 ribonuclease Z [Candidatus Woesearchaeota archaeon]
MELIFLGTSSMVPTKERNHTSMLLNFGSEGILFDCGEGTQRQLKMISIKPSRITKVLISHWHGDHVLGLPGLIQTLGASEYSGRLTVFGPRHTSERLKAMNRAFVFEDSIDFDVRDIGQGRFFESDDFALEAALLDHGIECLGYSFIEKDRLRINLKVTRSLGIPEGPLLGRLQSGHPIKWKGRLVGPEQATYTVKGKKISYIADTLPCDSAIALAKDADLLICEATYASSLEGKAREYKHMTARQAAFIANQASAARLILTHFSQRYKNALELEEDARANFDNVSCAEDFMRVVL